MARHPVVPASSTYRLQLGPGLDLFGAAELVPYLRDLGVTHLYLSPVLQAAPGSPDGYDSVRPDRVDDDRGGEEGMAVLLAALRGAGLGLVLDVVAGHLGASPEHNPVVWDLLRLGPDSPYAGWVDVDEEDRLVLPVLPYPVHAGASELPGVEREDGGLRCPAGLLPLAPDTGDGPVTEVLAQQHYKLVGWREGNQLVTHRRPFGVPGLVGLRWQEPGVFEAMHQRVLAWAAAGDIDGVRIDHVDGLAQPGRYLRRLAAELPTGSWVAVEKILPAGEDLPASWPCAGTTGYEALQMVGGLFVDPAAEAAFTELDRELTGQSAGWDETVRTARREVLAEGLVPELRRIGRLTPGTDPAALPLLLSHLRVYGLDLPGRRGHLAAAAAAAAAAEPGLAAAVTALAERLAHPDHPLTVAVGQVCADLAVLAVEFVAFYRWSRFLGLNETGGDPSRFGDDPERFHDWCRQRQSTRPAAMTTLSTHDTKRATEDVRARLAVLSELPARWAAAVRGWSAAAPLDPPEATHLFWQTVVGAWPLDRARLTEAWRRALRDAGRHTTNARPDLNYEEAATTPVRALFADPGLAASVDRFVRVVDPPGRANALGQKLLQLTMPGVPDTYQGTEVPSWRLVAPDNRGPVDFAGLRRCLAEVDAPGAPAPTLDDPRPAKLAVVSRALRLRRDRPEAFRSYRPLRPAGPAAAHAVAFDRGGAIAVVTRLPVRLRRSGGWRDTVLPLPAGRWRDVLTGQAASGEAALAGLLADLPVALLARD